MVNGLPVEEASGRFDEFLKGTLPSRDLLEEEPEQSEETPPDNT